MKQPRILPVLVAFAAVSGLLAQPARSQEISLTNLSYSLQDSDVVVHYDLNGPSDKSYEIGIVLKRESEPYFKMLPKAVAGQVGSGTFAGKNREIVWHLYRDVPNGLEGEDYYFQVTASMIVPGHGGGIPWYYYVGGAVVGGAAAVYFGTDVFGSSGGAGHLPGPPSRPPQ